VASDTAENGVCLAAEAEQIEMDSVSFLRVMMAKGKL
jgi:hypothetical protein